MAVYAALLVFLIISQTGLAIAAGWGAAKLRQQSAAHHYAKSFEFSLGRGGVKLNSNTRYQSQQVPRRAHTRTTPSGGTTSVRRGTTTVKKKVNK